MSERVDHDARMALRAAVLAGQLLPPDALDGWVRYTDALEATVRSLAALGLAACARYAAAQGTLQAYHPCGATERAEAAAWLAATITAVRSQTYYVLGALPEEVP